MTGVTTLIVVGLILIQLFDILIHAFSEQLELLRVLSNAVMLGWIGYGFLRSSSQLSKGLGYGALAIYLLLNGVFLATYGIRNPAQGDSLRIVLFILVGLTVGLALWLLSKLES